MTENTFYCVCDKSDIERASHTVISSIPGITSNMACCAGTIRRARLRWEGETDRVREKILGVLQQVGSLLFSLSPAIFSSFFTICIPA